MPQGYQELRSSAAALDLSSRAKFRITGDDRARLLHALTTNHIQQLTPGSGCYAFFLNAQGRILADAQVLCREDSFLLDLEPEVRAAMFAHIDHYIIADDVTPEDITDSVAAIGVEGPAAADVLTALGAPLPEARYAHREWNEWLVAQISFTGAPGYRVYLPMKDKAVLLDRLAAKGAPLAADEASRIARLEHFRPRYGEDITDKTLSQETQQMQALHFGKGCYLGQEIVERVRSRGLVHRLLVGVEIEGDEVPHSDDRLLAGNEDAGKITSAAYSPALAKVVAMGYVRRDLATPGTQLTLEGRQAEVRAPS